MSDFWQQFNNFRIDQFTIYIAWLLVVANWRSPIIRNLALANVLIALAGSQLMSYIGELPNEQHRFYWYLGASSVNFFKALFILGLISFNIAYMCKTSAQLMAIFTTLGVLNIARFIDRYLFGGGKDGSWLGVSYDILVPALNFLALLALTLPVWQHWRSSRRKVTKFDFPQ